MKFDDLPQYISGGHYQIHVGWDFLKYQLDRYSEHYTLQMDPDFQRGRVWTRSQKIAYVEYILRGGRSSRDVWFNCIGWMGRGNSRDMVLVDGLQRISSVLEFMDNKFRIFSWLDDNNKGFLFRDFEDKLGSMEPYFVFHINNLPTRKLVLQWYIDLNEGGTPHTKQELRKVKDLLLKEITAHGGTEKT